MRNPALPAMLLAGLFVGCSDVPVQPDQPAVSFAHTVRNQPALQQALAAIRQATARYHDTDKAESDGYVDLVDCITGPPGAGDMGVHYMKGAAVDGAFDPLEPEFLVYEPRGADGSLHLVALEYYVPDETPTEGEAPELEGQHFHVLPEGHPLFPGYALHVWAWRHNPAGIFEDFNPKVSCPA